jgi:tRNA (pseudouridine54-N1)-methyltransferase
MREFIYYSAKGRTSGNFKDLMSAGRLDIACHAVISSFFLSNRIREDVKLNLILDGPPDAPKHLEFIYDKEIPISKKDVGGLLKRMLFKYKKDKRNEVFPGCFIEKKSLRNLIKENNNRNIYLLDKKGKDIREIEIKKDPIFILGDQDGINKKEKKFIIKNFNINLISIGNFDYFSSQVISIVNNEVDRKEL